MLRPTTSNSDDAADNQLEDSSSEITQTELEVKSDASSEVMELNANDYHLSWWNPASWQWSEDDYLNTLPQRLVRSDQ